MSQEEKKYETETIEEDNPIIEEVMNFLFRLQRITKDPTIIKIEVNKLAYVHRKHLKLFVDTYNRGISVIEDDRFSPRDLDDFQHAVTTIQEQFLVLKLAKSYRKAKQREEEKMPEENKPLLSTATKENIPEIVVQEEKTDDVKIPRKSSKIDMKELTERSTIHNDLVIAITGILSNSQSKQFELTQCMINNPDAFGHAIIEVILKMEVTPEQSKKWKCIIL